mmetsp:Transcript_54245/g.176244  ORF Transcript_54245/g.176244 Transcript_54245/m.176244 type:complete len:278 (+) Transcript_54245:72-905(+)
MTKKAQKSPGLWKAQALGSDAQQLLQSVIASAQEGLSKLREQDPLMADVGSASGIPKAQVLGEEASKHLRGILASTQEYLSTRARGSASHDLLQAIAASTQEALSKLEEQGRELATARIEPTPWGGKPAATPCPSGHQMMSFRTCCKGYVCDRCSAPFPSGALLFACRTCNFDACQACDESAEAALVSLLASASSSNGPLPPAAAAAAALGGASLRGASSEESGAAAASAATPEDQETNTLIVPVYVGGDTSASQSQDGFLQQPWMVQMPAVTMAGN